MTRSITILSLIVVLGACQQNDPAPAQTAPVAPVAAGSELTPEQLGALGAQIRKDPSQGDELLARHGLTRESFEKAIREITENADASRRYAEAYRRGSA